MERTYDTAVFSVIFPENESYFNDYLYSLKAQTISEFDLVVMNDGVKDIPKEFNDFNFKVFPAKESLARTREEGINILMTLGYQKIIFADTDDMLSKNRVEVSVDLLDTYDLIANDLDLITEKGKVFQRGFWQSRLPNETSISPEFLMDQNVFGLGNSAIKGKLLKPIKVPSELQVVDWYIFLHLLNEDHKAIFTDKASTKYRIRKDNLGSIGKVTIDSVLRALDVKYRYYELMAGESEEYHSRYQKAVLLKEKFSDPSFLKDYFVKRSKVLKNPFWWEEVPCN